MKFLKEAPSKFWSAFKFVGKAVGLLIVACMSWLMATFILQVIYLFNMPTEMWLGSIFFLMVYGAAFVTFFRSAMWLTAAVHSLYLVLEALWTEVKVKDSRTPVYQFAG